MAGEKLTKNQTLVLDALSAAQGPLSAYDILDRLRPEGLRSPLQVYRALGPLVDRGQVHRLESLNSFVACAHPHGHAHSVTSFAICNACGQVDEFTDEVIGGRLHGWASDNRFKPARTTVEMRGTCAGCTEAA